MPDYQGVMNCMRCGKKIPHPDNNNADYVIAPEFIVKEPRDVFYALKYNTQTKAKIAADPNAFIDDQELDEVEVPDVRNAQTISDVVKVIVRIEEKDIQKTGIICPDCYRDTDFVIWGVHKEESLNGRRDVSGNN